MKSRIFALILLAAVVAACARPAAQPTATPPQPPTASPPPATATAVPTAAPASPMFRGGAERSGLYAAQGPVYEWAYDTGEPIISSPVPAGEVVLINTLAGRLVAVGLADGQERWSHAGSGETFASPAVADGSAYSADGSGEVTRLDVGTGEVQWQFQADGGVQSSPALYDGKVFFTALSGRVYALDMETGEEIWHYDLQAPAIPSPLVSEDGLFVASNNDFLVALDPQTGEKRWMFLMEGGDIQSSPAYADGVVYVASGREQSGGLAAVDARTGKKKWAIKSNWPVVATPAVVDGTVYIGGTEGVFFALDAQNGEPRWQSSQNTMISSAAVAGDAVYAGDTTGRVFALERDSGEQLWEFRTHGEVWSSPAVLGGTLLIASQDGRLYALDRAGPSQSLVPTEMPVVLAPTPTRMPPPAETPEPGSGGLPWWNDRVFYEVFVRSFKDSDGDGIGDLRGLIDSLDYLNDGNPATSTDLGVTGIWLMPVTESPSYHGYDVTDYKNVEPDYGTNDDLRELIAAAHERGISVIIDLVMNHTSNQHPWFEQALQPGSPYENWYIWEDLPPQMVSPWGSRVWHPAGGRYYYGLFWEGMPDLNYRNGEVTEAMFDIIDFWLTDMGVDGFRLDAVRHLIEEGQVQENTASSHEWLKTFFNFVKNTAPQSLTVGEAWTSTEEVVKFIGDEVDIAFEFDLAEATLQGVLTGSSAGLRAAAAKTLAAYPEGQYATFLTNHDQDRVINQLRNNLEKARLAAGLLLTGPGVPFIYYGEEIGLEGVKPDERIRTPMKWSTEPGGGFTSGTPWQPFAGRLEGKNVAEQSADRGSLLSGYRSLISLRQQHAALRTGRQVLASANQDAVYSFLRIGEEETLLVVANLSESEVSDYALSLREGPLAGVSRAENVLDAAGAQAPQINQQGGFDGYQPLASLPPLSLAVIRLR